MDQWLELIGKGRNSSCKSSRERQNEGGGDEDEDGDEEDLISFNDCQLEGE